MRKNGYEEVEPAKLIPVRGVRKFSFDGNVLRISGYAYFDEMLEKNPHKIEHSILVKRDYNNQGVSTINEETSEVDSINDYVKDDVIYEASVQRDSSANQVIESLNNVADAATYSDNYSYSAKIDFGTIYDGHPLDSGSYTLTVRLKQFVDGRWIAHDFSLGEIENLESDFIYATKMNLYAEKYVTKYSFVATQNVGSRTIQIVSNKLAKVNPAELIVRDEVIDVERHKISKIKKAIFRLAYEYYRRFSKIKSKRVSFLSDSRVDITGNFEYIYDEMKRRQTDLESRFYFKKTNNEPKKLREYVTLAKAIATSRFVLLDDFYPLIYPLTIRDGVELVQVWHAVGAFKTFGFSRVGMPGGPKLSSKNHRNYSAALVSSTNVVPNYAEGFGIDQRRVLPLGAPRTDLFFDEDKKRDVKARLTDEMPFIKGKKVVLFAPTFRGPGQNTAHYPFDWLDYETLYNKLAKEGFIFLFKIHPFVKNSPSIPYEYSNFFYDVSDYREVNDLLLIADVMITDYSSVVFEYSLLRRKTIFFAPDLSEYISSRNFYVDYQEFIPGPHVIDTMGLVQEIKNYKEVDTDRIDSFLNYYFDNLDGKASSRVVDALETGFGFDSEGTEQVQFSEDGKRIPRWGSK
ncbi:CDP-glycerol glycerophosphotransferase family protein [Weissella cibaria]|uniref:CDP-glycerol glycerophosphotransferase family protein n=1 Tax=Weissella cibaria TaxID=137591 RepID=UPI00223C43BC|nr:CDP-glycerol glycerophosphotransferase family protein [Weissella cibaria]MCS8560829.1 CDP-glycerol--poly(glycerophosphate) glycerophosphotransferase [Weissella cibaria]MCS8564821.1 CDP-glycerol--poly(glycerophosphate) glycerophosphotransferase [Weissella cibaria]MCS8576568.1 CDP-glycerol--poly(glycerophosphate) glycerophosphotransferase [Weissella cibaria]MCT0000959.1 CDP-glycerol--poly(glycerophosphate) glycerophosphotransferase [Weissella cibaria]